MAQYIFGFLLALFGIAALADDDCDVEREMQAAAERKMSKAQLDVLHDQAISLCSRKASYASDLRKWKRDQEYIRAMQNLNARFCGPDPDSIGRGAKCRQAKAELDTFIANNEQDFKMLVANEKRIKRLDSQFQKAKNASAAWPNRKDAIATAKQTMSAAISKVKQDILDSLKDPDSAKFRRIVVSADGTFVCGEVNAKNAMGGYVGYKKFANIEHMEYDFIFYEDTGSVTVQAECEKLSQR